MVANSLVARVFHALQRIRDRIWLHAVYVLGLVGGSLLLIGPLRVQGVAVAAVIATNVLVGLSFLALGGYRQGLGVRRIAGVMGRSYVFGAVVYLAYRLLSVDSLLAGWRETGAFWDAVLAGLGKAAFVFALYIGIHALYRRLGRPTRPSSPTAGGE
jgi:peptidoglycan biosynthesis protein MviN/MurJ (putative lipid II flippase)